MVRKTAGKKSKNVAEALSPDEVIGPSPNAATNLAIADIALRGGSAIARRAMEHALLGRKYAPKKAKAILKGRTLTESLVHGAIARIAMRSVPGAILVGGGLLAKTLYDRTKARRATESGERTLGAMAEKGDDTSSDKPE